MKKLLLLAVAVSLPVSVFAVPVVKDAPANGNTITCAPVNNSSWTKIPTTTLKGRITSFASNSTTTTFLCTTDNTVAVSSTVIPMTIGPKQNTPLNFDDTINTYFRSVDSTDGNICTDEQTYR